MSGYWMKTRSANTRLTQLQELLSICNTIVRLVMVTDCLNSPVEGDPHLASQPASYLINQMLDIKYKRRSNGMTTIMWPTINRVSDSEIHQIGQYLARIQ